MRRLFLVAALAASGCWDFDALSSGGALSDGPIERPPDFAGFDGPIPDLVRLPDLATLPDLHRRTLSLGQLVTATTDATPYGIAIGDFDGDQSPDFAILSATIHTVEPFLNDGLGNFAPKSKVSVAGNFDSWIVAGKIYGTGHVDLVVPNASSLSGDGTGAFSEHTWSVVTGSTPSVLADFDKDGVLDLFTGDAKIHFFRGDGAGGFTAGGSFSAGVTTFDLVAADFDGDGLLDLAQADGDATMGGVRIMKNNGAGNLQLVTTFTAVHDIGAVAAGDLDNDGDPDLVAIAAASSKALVFLDDKGTLVAAPDSFSIGAMSASAALGDLDGDGLLDLVVSSAGEARIYVLLGDGTGKFAPAVTFDTKSAAGTVRLVDVNKDGLLDVVVTLPTKPGVAVLTNLSM